MCFVSCIMLKNYNLYVVFSLKINSLVILKYWDRRIDLKADAFKNQIWTDLVLCVIQWLGSCQFENLLLNLIKCYVLVVLNLQFPSESSEGLLITHWWSAINIINSADLGWGQSLYIFLFLMYFQFLVSLLLFLF